MSLASKPKKSKEEKALDAAQARELDRTQDEINERKRRILRSEMGGRSSLLSGSERGVRPGETRLVSGVVGSGLSGGGRGGVRGGVRGAGGGGGGGVRHGGYGGRR
jgi:hypothetical protein